MILEITKEPNPLLHQVSKNLTAEEINSKEIKEFVGNLIETMYAKDGVGIASVQVGNPIQLCIIAKNFTPSKKEDLILINPSFEKKSILREWSEEGCLSVPNIYGSVRRFKKIKVSALNAKGEKVEFMATDFFARIIQHEIDHLNGILFIEKAKKLHTYEKNRI
ncbi:MAG TPA: peptide deformylase [Candidatus Udaeobacter sp.]|nr:peptide deformylase [Candidatus Udaeobacter sp.]